ncbi:cupin domain-containing protein [Deinococcus detaillensis]|uniref:Cupin domain-containing protein n=1 Tax=Deinococcus detaillensis TaxID=2592048 RepID=A0A553UNB1_9DEIO|nr:cupin domain-containing protein [Deinococcus detaillensis]TSA81708.1 cupin domain-containing protein [Deinococcus detaillensis]
MFMLKGREDPSNVILHIPARTRRSFRFAGDLFTVLVTGEESGGSYTTMEVLVSPGGGPGLHQHEAEEEQFYVLSGQLTYQVGPRTFEVKAGDFVHIPRQTPHSITNGPQPARLLATFSPAGPERSFMEAGVWLSPDESDPWTSPGEQI